MKRVASSTASDTGSCARDMTRWVSTVRRCEHGSVEWDTSSGRCEGRRDQHLALASSGCRPRTMGAKAVGLGQIPALAPAAADLLLMAGNSRPASVRCRAWLTPPRTVGLTAMARVTRG